jgi:uncharacterized protein
VTELDLDRLAAGLGRHGEVTAAYLFGSHARAQAHRESDIDVAVLLRWEDFPSAGDPERGPKLLDLRLRLIADLAAATGSDRLDLVLMNEAPPLLNRAILHEGLLFAVKDRRALLDFRVQTEQRAADLAPWLARWERRLLARLGEGP